MSATPPKRLKLRVAIIVGFLVVVAYLGLRYERYMELQKASTYHYSSLEALLEDVEKLGGQLVVCRHDECQDVKTHEAVGKGRDGYYIVYPDGTDVTPEVIKHQGDEIRRMTQTGQQL